MCGSAVGTGGDGVTGGSLDAGVMAVGPELAAVGPELAGCAELGAGSELAPADVCAAPLVAGLVGFAACDDPEVQPARSAPTQITAAATRRPVGITASVCRLRDTRADHPS